MNEVRLPDYYESLQISVNAEPDTVHRVFRLLAQRFHPDNQETGDIAQFKAISEAYGVLSDPEQRARYDLHHQEIRRDRLRLVDAGNEVQGRFQVEQLVRLTVLEALYAQRKLEPNNPGIFDLDLEGHHRPVARAPLLHVLVPDCEETGQSRRSVAAHHHGRRRGLPGAELRSERAIEAAGGGQGRGRLISRASEGG